MIGMYGQWFVNELCKPLVEKSSLTYIQRMPRPKEFEERVQITVLLDKSELDELTAISESEQKSRNRLIRGILQRYIKRWKSRQP